MASSVCTVFLVHTLNSVHIFAVVSKTIGSHDLCVYKMMVHHATMAFVFVFAWM